LPFGVSCFFFSSLCPPGTAAASVVAVAVGFALEEESSSFQEPRPPPLPSFKIWAAKC